MRQWINEGWLSEGLGSVDAGGINLRGVRHQVFHIGAVQGPITYNSLEDQWETRNRTLEASPSFSTDQVGVLSRCSPSLLFLIDTSFWALNRQDPAFYPHPHPSLAMTQISLVNIYGMNFTRLMNKPDRPIPHTLLLPLPSGSTQKVLPDLHWRRGRETTLSTLIRVCTSETVPGVLRAAGLLYELTFPKGGDKRALGHKLPSHKALC